MEKPNFLFDMKRLLVLLAVIFSSPVFSQVIYPYRTCSSPSELKEFSGLAYIKPNVLAAVNDGGNSASVYFLDTTGKLLRTRTIKGLKNIDWEELFYDKGKLYIADVGDNNNVRKKITVYTFDLQKDTVTGKTDFGFAGKNKSGLKDSEKHYDCEAGFVLDKQFYFFSKTHASPYTGKSVQYNVEKDKTGQEYTGVDSAFFGTKGFIYNSLTGAAISAEKNNVAFISCTRLWVRHQPKNNVFLNSGLLFSFEFDGFTQKEAITFTGDTKFVVADERSFGFMGGRMYFYDLQPYFTGKKKYISPLVKQASLKKNRKGGYDFSFFYLDKASEANLLLVDALGNIVYETTIALKDNQAKIQLPAVGVAGKAVAFWIAMAGKVVYTSEIIKP